MRLSFLILFISLAFSCLAQQLKIDKSTQPQIGDQFSFQESNLSLADYRDIHNKKIWDFDILKKSGITNSKIIENFSSEMEGDFLLEIGGVVKYGLKQNRKSLDIVSFKDQAGLSESLNVVFDCIEPELFRPNSIYKGLRDRSESKCIAEITKNQLPPNLKDFLSPEISSTRVVRTTKHIFKADKQGILKFGNLEEKALLLRIVKHVSFRLEIYLNGEVWVKAPKQLEKDLGFDGFSVSTEEDQIFTEQSSMPIIIASREKDDLVWLRYQTEKIYQLQEVSVNGKSQVNAYPNPTFGEIYFDFLNCPLGEYHVEIYNIIGKKIHVEKINVDRNKSVLLNFEFLSKGTYLYSVINKKKEKLQTKRLIKIDP